MEKGNIDIQQELADFLKEWNSDSPSIRVQTSGSTGAPKPMMVRKEQMCNSARMTCDYLGLRQGDKALLCMPLKYIAGKMMVVRSLVGGLDLTVSQPTGHPLAEVETPIRFAAMIPLQVYNSLQVPEERKRLEQIEILIIGGGAIDPSLEQEIRKLPGRVYSTYGMTETLSHIALRRLNGPEASDYYTPFPNVSLSLSEAETLVIDAPAVADQQLVTNDLAELLPDGRFRILGRRDNRIVSGGIKMQIEEIEERLRPVLPFDYAITSVPDPKFGEAVVLLFVASDATYKYRHPILISSDTQSLPRSTPNPYKDGDSILIRIDTQSKKVLPKYQQPKYIVPVTAIPQTETGKINRAECRRLAIESITQLNINKV